MRMIVKANVIDDADADDLDYDGDNLDRNDDVLR